MTCSISLNRFWKRAILLGFFLALWCDLSMSNGAWHDGWLTCRLFIKLIIRAKDINVKELELFLNQALMSFSWRNWANWQDCQSISIGSLSSAQRVASFLRKKLSRRNKAGYTANTSCGRVGRGRNACFHTFRLVFTDQRTNQPTNRPTDGRTKPLIELRVRN